MSTESLYDSLLEVAKKRRSVRQLKPDPIPDESIGKIIEVARWAPSAFNTQPWEFVVVKDKGLRTKIAETLGHPAGVQSVSQNRVLRSSSADHFLNAPVFIILLGDWRAKVGLPGVAVQQNRRVDTLFPSSLASAFLYMHMAAAALGLSSCWVTRVAQPEPARKIREILGIPLVMKIYDMMALGYGAHAPIPKEPRKLADMTHYDYCGEEDFRTDEQILAEAEKTKAWCFAAH